MVNGRHYLGDIVLRMRKTLAKTKHRAQILQFRFPFFLRLEDQFAVIASILSRQEKTSKDSKWHFSIYCR